MKFIFVLAFKASSGEPEPVSAVEGGDAADLDRGAAVQWLRQSITKGLFPGRSIRSQELASRSRIAHRPAALW